MQRVSTKIHQGWLKATGIGDLWALWQGHPL
jgi:hypothetical protein